MHPPEGVAAVEVGVAAAAMQCAVMAAAAMPCAVMAAASECVVAGGRVRASVTAVPALTVRLMRVADSSVAITSIVEGMVIGIADTDGGGDTAGLWLLESALQ